MNFLYWLFIVIAYLCVGEAITLFTAFLMPQSVLDKNGRFAWYWVSARILLWWMVLIIGFFYILSVPVRMVLQRVTLTKSPNASLRKVG